MRVRMEVDDGGTGGAGYGNILRERYRREKHKRDRSNQRRIIESYVVGSQIEVARNWT